MPRPRLEIGNTLQAMGTAFQENRPLIVQLTVVFALVNAISTLLDIAGPAGFAISFGITILLGASYGGMITALLCLPGKTEGAGELWTTVKPVLARLIWVTLITAAAVVAGLLALVVPGLVLVTILAVAGQCVVVERRGVFEALGRSTELVRDNGWRVFAFLLIIGLLSLIMLGLALLVSAPFGTSLAARLIANFLANLLSTPVLTIGAAVLYNQLSQIARTGNPGPGQAGS
ncbi:MAG: hypothetical protein KDB52_04360 [Solirubrobacterales bacterium]|nr:hypothetical protein [Solirubrobacterales bacterium]